jgi:hypothetical protein
MKEEHATVCILISRIGWYKEKLNTREKVTPSTGSPSQEAHSSRSPSLRSNDAPKE